MMATSSIYIASEEVYDYNCSKCEQLDKTVKAQHFCPECKHYLCDNCLKLHNGYNIEHTVYGRGDIRKWVGFFLDRCDQHGHKIELHCDDHKELCCSVCVALNHRQCSSISHLCDLARGFLSTEEFKQLPAAVDKMNSMLNELKNARLKYKATLKDSYDNIMAEIKAFRKEINNILDHLEKKTVEQMNSFVKNLEKDVQNDIDTCAQMHDQLKTMMEQVQQMSGKRRETNSYIGYKKCQSQLTKCQCVTHEILANPKERVLFYPKTQIDTFLKGFDNLGNTDKAYKFMYSSVRVNSIYGHSEGICEMPNGDIIIAEGIDNNLILLNREYKDIAQCGLPGEPRALCHTVGNKVCVAVYKKGIFTNTQELHFVKVTKKVQKVRKFTIDHICNSLAHYQGQLYIGSNTALYQYTMDGELVKKIYEDMSSDCTVFNCAVSLDGERIYVTNIDEDKLLTLDKSGQVLSTLKDPNLTFPAHICVSQRGHVFVWGVDSYTVLQVDREGTEKLALLNMEGDAFIRPHSMCFSEQTSTLIGCCFFQIIIIKIG